MRITEGIRAWAQGIKRDGLTLWFASKHPDVPWHAKALGAVVVAYALSPIDLIPDFVPVLGYLDDVLLLPALIWLALRWIPAPLLAECRAQADGWLQTHAQKPISRWGALLVVAIWLVTALAFWRWVVKA